MTDAASTSSTTAPVGGDGSSAPTRESGRCASTTLTGQPCPVRPQHGSAYCFQHDPDPAVAARRTLARRAGGVGAARVLAPEDAAAPVLDSPKGVRRVIADTIQAVRTGRISPPVAQAVFTGIQAALKLADIEVGAQLNELRRVMRERGMLR